jgi:Asp-tRNA(Asn)/Glu-tRNA(Gln) amidotransferase A subunit family amidase
MLGKAEETDMISLADLQRRIDQGELSPEAALRQSQEAIATHEETICAFASLAANPRAQSAGPLRGIAVGIKDIIDTSDAAGIEDLARGLSAMTNRPELLPHPVSAPRIGLVTQDFAGQADMESAEALRIAARVLERAGASVRQLKLADIVAEAWRIQPTVQMFEAHQAFAWEYRENTDAMPPMLRARLDDSRGITVADYDAARAIAIRARTALSEAFRDVDATLTLSAPGAAPKGLGSTGDARYNRLWTLMGTPCVNVPAHDAGGLPVGVQVVADYGDDAKALGVAQFLETALKLHR